MAGTSNLTSVELKIFHSETTEVTDGVKKSILVIPTESTKEIPLGSGKMLSVTYSSGKDAAADAKKVINTESVSAFSQTLFQAMVNGQVRSYFDDTDNTLKKMVARIKTTQLREKFQSWSKCVTLLKEKKDLKNKISRIKISTPPHIPYTPLQTNKLRKNESRIEEINDELEKKFEIKMEDGKRVEKTCQEFYLEYEKQRNFNTILIEMAISKLVGGQKIMKEEASVLAGGAEVQQGQCGAVADTEEGEDWVIVESSEFRDVEMSTRNGSLNSGDEDEEKRA